MGDLDEDVRRDDEGLANGEGNEVAPETDASAAEAEAAADAPLTVEQLQAELAERDDALRQSREDYLREKAEVENFKRRMQRDKAEQLRYANEPLLRDLLPVIDNLERAMAHAADSAVSEGLQMVLKELLDVVGRHGAERLDAVGTPFDPAQHEAVAQAESAEHDPGAVIEEHQIGYKIHDRLLRPAMVTVNSRKAEAPVETPQNSD